MRFRVLLVVASAALLAVTAPVASGNTTFTSNGHSISFFDKGGNEWWVEVIVQGTSASEVSGVDAMDTGGPWVALTHESWGSWGASFHVETGHLVTYRAHFPDGTVITSCPFTHPAGVEQCGSAPPSGSFSASFTNVKGNDWWIQAHVTATGGTLANVDVALNGGAWQPLTLQSWGDWAASYHAPTGTLVQLRATSTQGNTSLSSCYHWTDAAVVSCGAAPPPSAFQATFAPKPGNEWWIEVYVNANQPLAGVDARVNGASWTPLTLRSWGAWAVSIHVPNGSLVDFRARATDGSAVTSGQYIWPSATPVSTPANVWPHEGSFVRAQDDSSEGVPGFSSETERNETYVFHNGNWTLTWDSWTFHHFDYDPANDSFVRDNGTSASEPLRGPTWNLKIGDETPYGTVTSQTDRNATRNGTPVVSRVWYAQFHPVWPEAIDAYWHTGTGLMLELFDARSHSGESYRVLDTDAPIAKTDPLSGPPARTAWPFAGSYANYNELETYSGYTSGYNATNVSFSYQNGYWQGVCAWHLHDSSSGDISGTMRFASGPLFLPTNVTVGTNVTAGRYTDPCLLAYVPDLTVQAASSVATLRNSAPFTAKAWMGNETDPDGPRGTAWWDAGIGILLRYEQTQWMQVSVLLKDTDAPLTKA